MYRFINADAWVSTGQGLLGNNMFAYCRNNPVCRKDSAGTDDISVLDNNDDDNPLNDYIGKGGAGGGGSSSSYYVDFSVAQYSSIYSGGIYNTGYTSYYAAPTAACFVAGTLVNSADGTVPIEDISVGDTVWAWDEESGEIALKEVVETYINETDELVHIVVNGEEIISTPSHPFYSPVKGWTEAVELRAGDMLVLVNGDYVVVEKVQHEILESPVIVYNFQVADYHTYYVGTCTVLVHNVCGANPPSKGVGNKGWVGDKTWRENVSTVADGGTITSLKGGVPTESQALQLIDQSGGISLRIEEAHEYPNPHNFAHINYLTRTGVKGTIKITK